MPPRAKAGKSKSKGKKSGRKSNRSANGDMARVSVTLGQFQLFSNQTFGAYNFALSNSDRAKQVAQAYQFYRIRRVTMKVKPLYDTYMGTSGGIGVPNFYYMLDKARIFPAGVNLLALKSAGAKPHRLDDKTLTVSWAPAVTNVSVVSASPGVGTLPQLGPSTYKVSPWISTNANSQVTLGTAPWAANSVDHAGIVLAAEQLGQGVSQTQPVMAIEFVVDFEFKKRLWEPAVSDERIKYLNLDSLAIEDPEEPVSEAK